MLGLSREAAMQVMMTAGPGLAQLFNGYDSGYVSVMVADSDFIDYFNIGSARLGAFSSSIVWGGVGFSMFYIAPAIPHRFGRRWGFIACSCFIIVGVIMQVATGPYYGVLVVGRILCGIGIGLESVTLSPYLSECMPKNTRGATIAVATQGGYQLGSLISFWAGYGLSYTGIKHLPWRLGNGLQIFFGVLLILVALWIPESPRWLMDKFPDQPDRVLHSLRRLRCKDENDEEIMAEYNDIRLYHEWTMKHRGLSTMDILKNKSLRKRLIYGFLTMGFQQFGGIAVLTMYAVLIYESLGWETGNKALALQGIGGALQLVAVFPSIYIIEHFGRKKMLIGSIGTQFVFIFLLGIMTTVYPDHNNRHANIFSVACIMITQIAYCCGNGPATFAYTSEIFPSIVRSQAMAISLWGQISMLILLPQVWPFIEDAIAGRAYFILAGFNFIMVIALALFWKETKGVSIEHLDSIFGEIDIVQEEIHEETALDTPSNGAEKSQAEYDHVEFPPKSK